MSRRRHPDERPNGWLVCDEGICLYADDRRIDRLKSDSPRCIKHGALLFPGWCLDGMTRREARNELNRRARCKGGSP